MDKHFDGGGDDEGDDEDDGGNNLEVMNLNLGLIIKCAISGCLCIDHFTEWVYF
jgi:hypothetical protein